MASRYSGRGGFGWAILAAALAVPGFLFYNWWAHLKAEHDHAVSSKTSRRADSGVFQPAPPLTGRLVNPMASSTSPARGLTPAVAGLKEGSVVPPAKRPIAPPPPNAAAAAALPAPAAIVLPRDPMMSPLDAVRLQEAALAEEERQRALAEKNHPRHARPAKKTPIEKHIQLQGIVAKSDGDNLAIINGATVNPGQSIKIRDYPGKVKILRITSSEVTLDYQGRKIRLRVSAE